MSVIIRLAAVAVLILCSAGLNAFAQGSVKQGPAKKVPYGEKRPGEPQLKAAPMPFETPQQEEKLLRKWIKELGSDEFGGRKPMTPYEDITLRYLKGEMEKIGLKPGFNGSWFQKVKMISTVTKPRKGNLQFKNGRKRANLDFPGDVVCWTARNTSKIEIKGAEYVFCGFGIDAPEYGWNDFDGIDVKGKIIISMVNDPGFYNPDLFRGRNMTWYGRWVYKFEQAERLGAAGCLVLHNTAAASYGWNVCSNHAGENLALYDEATENMATLPIKGWLAESGCRKLFEAAGVDFEAALEAAKQPGFKAFTLKGKSDIQLDVTSRIEESSNIAGLLEGSDLKDEVVVFSGHWDHFGFGDPDETGDEIYNGAADNGSGMAAVLLLAKKFKALATPPRRSMLFVCFTSEESGLFGSEYYCENPQFPMDKTAACINFDCIAPDALTHDVVVLGGGATELDNYLVAVAGAQGRYIDFNDDNSDGWFFRSDHFNFVKKGVPAVVIENGHHLAPGIEPNKYPRAVWYHKPSDEYREDWDFSGTLAHIHLMYGVGLAVANADKRPAPLRR